MRIILSWSSGKDSAWTLHTLRQQEIPVAGLLTTVNGTFERVAMHAVRVSLLQIQAQATGLPLHIVDLPWPCSNTIYEKRMQEATTLLRAEGITHIAYGDLFLEDVRAYREKQLQGTGIHPLFPLWHPSGGTQQLAYTMLQSGLKALLTCVDPQKIPAELAGEEYNKTLLSTLPPDIDPCGEKGEFHTFCYSGPMFNHPLPVRVGEKVERDGFSFADILTQTEQHPPPY